MYLFVYLSFFFSTLLVVNVKSFLLLFILNFLTWFFLFKKNIFESTFLTLLLSLPFENTIRQWSFYTPSFRNPFGYSFFFGVTIKIALGLAALLLISLPKYNFFLKKKLPKISVLLLLFYVFASITSVFFQDRLVFVFIGFVRLSLSVWFYYIASIYFSQKNEKYIFKYFIFSLVIFSTFIGLLQFTKQKPLGKFIELTPGFSLESGYSTTDGTKQYRIAGFISHPVYFGSFLSILIPIFLGIYLSTVNKKEVHVAVKIIYLFMLVLSLIVLLGVLSRSTWLNILLTISLFYFYIKKNGLTIWPTKLSSKIKKILFSFVLLILIFPVISIVTTRVKSIPDLFTNKDGSAYIRLLLANKAIELALIRPFTGVGLNNFSFENYKRFSIDYIAPPHNTALIFLAELGIPTTLLFISFIFFSLFPKNNIFKSDPSTFGTWIGLLTFIISSQFHPLFNLDPTFDLFMLILGYYSTCRQLKS